MDFTIIFVALLIMTAAVVYKLSPAVKLKKRLKQLDIELRTGNLSYALGELWKLRQDSRIHNFLNSNAEFPLPSGKWDRLWHELPNSRRFVLDAFSRAKTLSVAIHQSNNQFLDAEMKNDADEVLQYSVQYIWEICHRISLVVKSGAAKADIKELLEEKVQALSTVSQLLTDALIEINKHTSCGEDLSRDVFARQALDKLALRAKNLNESHCEIAKQIYQASGFNLLRERQ